MNLSQDRFSLHQENNRKSDHGTCGLQKAYFQTYIIHYHGPMSIAMGEAKEVLSLQMPRDHGKKNVVFPLISSFLFLSFAKQFLVGTKKEGEKKGEGLR